jgi:hypothetical protein
MKLTGFWMTLNEFAVIMTVPVPYKSMLGPPYWRQCFLAIWHVFEGSVSICERTVSNEHAVSVLIPIFCLGVLFHFAIALILVFIHLQIFWCVNQLDLATTCSLSFYIGIYIGNISLIYIGYILVIYVNMEQEPYPSPD